MKAIRIHEFGGPEQLRMDQVEIPELEPQQTLVRIRAASVNPVDWKIRQGGYLPHDVLPLTMGRDFSGVVEKVGNQVSKFRVGDAVFGIHDGSYAEFAVIPEKDLVLKPQNLDYVEAASVPLASLTAWQAVIDQAQISKGQRILIHGGSGGVGAFAIQFAKWKGAYVITTASDSAEYLKMIGADEVIDYKLERFEDEIKEQVDAVLDTIGGETQDRSWQVIKRGGVLVNLLHNVDHEKAKAAGVRTVEMVSKYSPEELEQIAKLIDLDLVHTHVAKVFSLEQAREAQEASHNGTYHGKIVLRVSA